MIGPLRYSFGSRKCKALAKRMESFLSKKLNVPPYSIPAYFIFKNYSLRSCRYVAKWQNFMKNSLELQWPLWGTFQIDKII